MTYKFVEGTSEPFDYKVEVIPGGTVPGSVSLSIDAVDREGVAVEGLTVSWVDQPTGILRMSGLEALTAANGPYRFRTRFDNGGVVFFAPTGDQPPDILAPLSH